MTTNLKFLRKNWRSRRNPVKNGSTCQQCKPRKTDPTWVNKASLRINNLDLFKNPSPRIVKNNSSVVEQPKEKENHTASSSASTRNARRNTP